MPSRTAELTARERVQMTLDHREPDRIPVDFGGTPVTGIHVSVVAGLREHFGLEHRPVKVHEPYQMLGVIDDDLKQAMGIDVDGVVPRETMFGFRNDDWATPPCRRAGACPRPATSSTRSSARTTSIRRRSTLATISRSSTS
jgi:hypothetical protein